MSEATHSQGVKYTHPFFYIHTSVLSIFLYLNKYSYETAAFIIIFHIASWNILADIINIKEEQSLQHRMVSNIHSIK